MPLPLDLASVAWLVTQSVGPMSMYRAWEYRARVRRENDLRRVLDDQRRYIRELEAMVRPTLVQPVGEQESMV